MHWTQKLAADFVFNKFENFTGDIGSRIALLPRPLALQQSSKQQKEEMATRSVSNISGTELS